MSVARRCALSLIAGLLLACSREPGQDDALKPRADRPQLLLLTSLPLAFGETLSLEEAGSPVLKTLNQRYRVESIATTSPNALNKARLLLMAQPLAQPAEDLVALDRWVRSGGRVLLLADPLLEWADSRPLGDPTRPPPMFMDTGLLNHWGLRLDAPDMRGDRPARIAGQAVTTRSPGSLHGSCEVAEDGLWADCKIGKGRAIIVADADFLDWRRGDQGQAALLAALNQLERR